MSALWGEMKVTACTPHAVKQSINSAISQDSKPCRALLPSTDVCSVSGPPRFVTLIACQGRSARWRVIEHRGSMQGGEGYANTWQASLELTASREQRNRHTVHL